MLQFDLSCQALSNAYFIAAIGDDPVRESSAIFTIGDNAVLATQESGLTTATENGPFQARDRKTGIGVTNSGRPVTMKEVKQHR